MIFIAHNFYYDLYKIIKIKYWLRLKGTATLMICMFYQEEFYKPWILIQVSSKSVEKMGKLWAFKEFNMANI